MDNLFRELEELIREAMVEAANAGFFSGDPGASERYTYKALELFRKYEPDERRDYFAAAVLTGLMSQARWECEIDTIARDSWALADAMISEDPSKGE